MGKVKKIIWTENGIDSLEEIIEHIAIDSPYYASNFAKKVISLIENLKHFPNIGRIVPEYKDKDIRELIYQNYRIIYLIKGNSINLIYIGHSSKNIPDQH